MSFRMEGRSGISDNLPERYDPNHCTRYAAPRTRRRLRTASLFPDTLHNTLDQRNLCPLLVLGQLVANLAAGKATLRRQIQVLERHVLYRLADALDDGVFVLELCRLGGHQAQHDLLAGGNVLERLKATGTRRIELKIERIDVLVCEQVRRDGAIAALKSIGRVVVAAAHVRVNDKVIGLALDCGVDDILEFVPEDNGGKENG